jgi:hypothetical protein
VEEVPIENIQVEVFTTSPTTEPTEASRRESGLVQRYRDWVVATGGELVRHKIAPAGAAQPLFTDTFNRVTGELVEAKGSAARYYIRLALGLNGAVTRDRRRYGVEERRTGRGGMITVMAGQGAF